MHADTTLRYIHYCTIVIAGVDMSICVTCKTKIWPGHEGDWVVSVDKVRGSDAIQFDVAESDLIDSIQCALILYSIRSDAIPFASG